MFSLLNNRFWTGKLPARMDKFLNSLPQFFRILFSPFSRAFYLIGDVRLRTAHFHAVGHRIASPVRQLVLLRIL